MKEMPRGETVREGYLLKKGSQRRNWKLRWFVLKKNYLVYLAGLNKKPKGVIVLDGCYLAITDKRAFAFVISFGTDSSKDIHIAAASQIERQQWIESIVGCIHNPLANTSPTKEISEQSSNEIVIPTVDPQASKRSYVRAMYEYKASEENELSFGIDDVISVLKEYSNSQWCKGMLRGNVGLFPTNFCVPIEKGTYCRAVYDYEAQEPNELTFVEEDIIKVVERLEGTLDWAVGELNNTGKYGMFPLTYVEQLNK